MRKTSFYYSNKLNNYRQIYQGGEKKVMRKSLAILLTFAMVFSMFSSLAFAADAELTAQQKYDALAAEGIFAGMSDGSDGLDQPMNRAQFARVAALIKGLEGIGAPDTKVVTVKPFSDVELGQWYTEEVAAVKEAGLFVGDGVGFKPEGDITVQELAVVVATLLTLEKVADSKVEGAED
ncbi:MAG: S-layer homology domain-containing protein, partial [Bacilli bacterium]